MFSAVPSSFDAPVATVRALPSAADAVGMVGTGKNVAVPEVQAEKVDVLSGQLGGKEFGAPKPCPYSDFRVRRGKSPNKIGASWTTSWQSPWASSYTVPFRDNGPFPIKLDLDNLLPAATLVTPPAATEGLAIVA